MSETSLRVKLLLLAQRALLGEVTPNLRSVTIAWKDFTVFLRFYFDGEISPDDEELASEVEGEIIAGFSDTWKIQSEVIRKDFPEPMDMLSDWIYRRKEYFEDDE